MVSSPKAHQYAYRFVRVAFMLAVLFVAEACNSATGPGHGRQSLLATADASDSLPVIVVLLDSVSNHVVFQDTIPVGTSKCISWAPDARAWLFAGGERDSAILSGVYVLDGQEYPRFMALRELPADSEWSADLLSPTQPFTTNAGGFVSPAVGHC